MALAGIRLANGAAALLAPAWLLHRLGADPDANPAALYVFRMFGIRTVVIGAALLAPNGEIRDQSLRSAPIIHASDTMAAIIAGLRRQLPGRAATRAALISSVNTVLAIMAQPRKV